MRFDPLELARPNIRRLTPYSSARTEFEGCAEVFLDANENSFGSPLPRDYNRYPDPVQTALRQRVAERSGVAREEVFAGNGSDEAIDLLLRVFCRPGRDNIVVCPPTYGMYRVSAEINDVPVREAFLTGDFELDPAAVRRQTDANTKIVFLCSPNNPTGNSLSREKILEVVATFGGIVVVDEAYIHFSGERSLAGEIAGHPNLVVLRTFSKAWGMAGLRVGLALADARVVGLLDRVKPPYNISQIAQEAVLRALGNADRMERTVAAVIAERERLIAALDGLRAVEKIYPTDANFVLVRTADAKAVYDFLIGEKIVVRNRSNVAMCGGCLRLTVGTPEENTRLIGALEKFGGRSRPAAGVFRSGETI